MKLQEWLSVLEITEPAVFAKNFYNFKTLFQVLQASEKTGSGIILQTSPSTIHNLGIEKATAITKAALHDYNVRKLTHLNDECFFFTPIES